MNQDLIIYIGCVILVAIAAFGWHCLIEYQTNELFKEWNEQFKNNEELE